MLVRRERWGLSWRGWLLVLALATLSVCLLGLRIYSFLAVTQRTDAKVLVVEGWVHEYAIRAAAREFRSGLYERVLATGGPVSGSGGYTNDFNTSASVGAELLKKCGLSDDLVQAVPSRITNHDRTYSSAIALRNWFHDHRVMVRSVNVVTEDVHARRTRLLFGKALGPEVRIGIIAIVNPDYDAKHWWRYSEGVKDVFGETIGYIYCRFFPLRAAPEEPGQSRGKR